MAKKADNDELKKAFIGYLKEREINRLQAANAWIVKREMAFPGRIGARKCDIVVPAVSKRSEILNRTT